MSKNGAAENKKNKIPDMNQYVHTTLNCISNLGMCEGFPFTNSILGKLSIKILTNFLHYAKNSRWQGVEETIIG
ncbi:MAG: hypothetical protein Q4G49_05580 [Paracoccus sp. (in: a-proteobacteria)]|nr:hypothetical protein [Paracoccus sp. (in: a-proteobacteria)]